MKRGLKKIFLLLSIVFITMIISSQKVEATTTNNITFNANYYSITNEDLWRAFGNNEQALLDHFVNCGIKEGRRASICFDLTYYKNTYGDLKKAFGANNQAYYDHFINYGIAEGRQGSADFNVKYYLSQYGDLQKAFGNNYKLAFEHYCNYGYKEGRKAVETVSNTTNNSNKDLENKYNSLLSQFNALQNSYNSLKESFTALQNKYTELENKYNKLVNGGNDKPSTEEKDYHDTTKENLDLAIAIVISNYYEDKYVDKIETGTVKEYCTVDKLQTELTSKGFKIYLINSEGKVDLSSYNTSSKVLAESSNAVANIAVLYRNVYYTFKVNAKENNDGTYDVIYVGTTTDIAN